MKIHNIRILCKGDHKICDGRTNISDHDPGYQKGGHAVQLSGKQKDKRRSMIRDPMKRRHRSACKRKPSRNFSRKYNHDQCHHHLRTGRDSQARTGLAIGFSKKCLQQKIRKGTAPPPSNGRHEDPGQADLPDDVILCLGASALSEDDPEDLRNRNIHTSRIDIQHRDQARKAAVRTANTSYITASAV